MLWKVGQTVGTFLWSCFCEVVKEGRAGWWGGGVGHLTTSVFSILRQCMHGKIVLLFQSCLNH